jgi:UDP-N-acetylglucosamine--N-acetylmuramyl-(pentapeptide) pyrophosphoryl-undecaprenol N-acetylglucosamine transferase
VSQGPIVLCAGGTGGHLFPAEALASVLRQRGQTVELITDARALRYGAQFPASVIHAVPAATPSSGSVIAKALAAVTLARGTLTARRLLKHINPRAVVGFGGYPTVPPVLAASHLSIATIIHEQNAVIGRANRFLAPRVTAIATGFAALIGADAFRAKVTHVGNPVRQAVIDASAIAYPEFDSGSLKLLVTGGSQGARIMSEIVPAAVARLSAAQRRRLAVVQQARPEDAESVARTYAELGVAAEVKSFFDDLPQRLAAAHLLIGRAGASTVCECAVIGRPAILVPLPGSLDQDQAANAAWLSDAGAAWVVPQAEFTPLRLAAELARQLASGDALKEAAAAAKRVGIANASWRLADLVLAVAGPTRISERRHETAA